MSNIYNINWIFTCLPYQYPNVYSYGIPHVW